jgi:mRNA interferase YafQ
MLRPFHVKRFEKDLKRMRARGKDEKKLMAVMLSLIEETPLEQRHRDHNLVGNYVGCRECHVEPDWLLVYSVGDDWIRFERTGTHSDLFE